jgi:hypothetical protein
VDIRRGNLQLHLMYKALFEMAADRADFVFLLFSRKRPDKLSAKATADELFQAVMTASGSQSLLEQNLAKIHDHLTRKHRFALTPEDLKGIEYIYGQFSYHGPGLSYWTSMRGSRNAPTYWDLMVADDGKGQFRSYLANEENFVFMKELHTRNMLVPVVGNFAGPKAIRSVARYLNERDATVTAFYLSNVEQYLSRDGAWETFCENVKTLPLDDASMFIRSVRNNMYGQGVGLDSEIRSMRSDVKSCR